MLTWRIWFRVGHSILCWREGNSSRIEEGIEEIIVQMEISREFSIESSLDTIRNWNRMRMGKPKLYWIHSNWIWSMWSVILPTQLFPIRQSQSIPERRWATRSILSTWMYLLDGQSTRMEYQLGNHFFGPESWLIHLQLGRRSGGDYDSYRRHLATPFLCLQCVNYHLNVKWSKKDFQNQDWDIDVWEDFLCTGKKENKLFSISIQISYNGNVMWCRNKAVTVYCELR